MTPVHIISLNIFFFFNDTATTEIYTLSLHDALPISAEDVRAGYDNVNLLRARFDRATHFANALGEWRKSSREAGRDRKSTRLNSSHSQISYAVFCLKKKNTTGICGVECEVCK